MGVSLPDLFPPQEAAARGVAAQMAGSAHTRSVALCSPARYGADRVVKRVADMLDADVVHVPLPRLVRERDGEVEFAIAEYVGRALGVRGYSFTRVLDAAVRVRRTRPTLIVWWEADQLRPSEMDEVLCLHPELQTHEIAMLPSGAVRSLQVFSVPSHHMARQFSSYSRGKQLLFDIASLSPGEVQAFGATLGWDERASRIVFDEAAGHPGLVELLSRDRRDTRLIASTTNRWPRADLDDGPLGEFFRELRLQIQRVPDVVNALAVLGTGSSSLPSSPVLQRWLARWIFTTEGDVPAVLRRWLDR